MSERFEQMVLVPNTPGQKAAAAKACRKYARDRDELRTLLMMLGLMPDG